MVAGPFQPLQSKQTCLLASDPHFSWVLTDLLLTKVLFRNKEILISRTGVANLSSCIVRAHNNKTLWMVLHGVFAFFILKRGLLMHLYRPSVEAHSGYKIEWSYWYVCLPLLAAVEIYDRVYAYQREICSTLWMKQRNQWPLLASTWNVLTNPALGWNRNREKIW